MAAKKKSSPRKTAGSKTAKRSATLVAALNKHAAALETHTLALESHAAILSAHAIAVTPAEARGACTILFTDNRPNYCANNKTNKECQELAAEMNGIARPIVAGQRCF